ncbi:MarR family transcriptional regulator [Nonlabens sp.]|uniref:MarR family winged helix-turn-helix transcriptional regulator n=1 Tax=Nonlabens sp. TaxID=1888209 RepID=UPI001BCC090C|nr:MarR family transcriptional regulator [Nonlabens sp.]
MSKELISIPLSRKLVTTLIKKGTEATEVISHTLKEHGITIQQFNVLRILRGRKGKAASLQDVSKEMIHANSNTTRVIDKLVDKKLVDRVQCPKDRRQIELTITADGLNLLIVLDQKVDAAESELTSQLDEQSLLILIEKLENI